MTRSFEVLEEELDQVIDREVGCANFCVVIPVPFEHKEEADKLVANVMEFAIYSWKNRA